METIPHTTDLSSTNHQTRLSAKAGSVICAPRCMQVLMCRRQYAPIVVGAARTFSSNLGIGAGGGLLMSDCLSGGTCEGVLFQISQALMPDASSFLSTISD